MGVLQYLMQGKPLTSHNPIADQQVPAFFRPVWHVGHLVFQGGNPRLKMSSMTGGGFLPRKDFAGHELPSWQQYATPVASTLGSGFFASRPNFLTALSGGQSTSQF